MTTFSVNVVGISNMVQAVYPFMCEGGSIVNISSISAHRAQADRWTYAASKGAITTVTQNMALDLAKKSIRVNSVSPGWTWTPEVAKESPKGTLEPIMEVVKKFHMIPRTAHTSEIASAVVFLCSRDASFINGTDLRVDGGYTAMSPERFGEETMIAGHNLSPDK
uniref:Uncharacterized protein LOC100183433 n=1 Tax=Phallusia mammillata TaxID=59560 RepID=A0A6F9DI28_9ASCI|nr:uncharacterized protein LOC100183433 [Phallusia mammillata]